MTNAQETQCKIKRQNEDSTLKLSPHLKRVATLPCEIQLILNFNRPGKRRLHKTLCIWVISDGASTLLLLQLKKLG